MLGRAVAILIGTGIGVTPFASILKNIWHVSPPRPAPVRSRPPGSLSLTLTRRYMQQKKKLGALRRVQFIWINRDTGSFEWFQSLLKQLEEHQSDRDFLQINMYLTAKMDGDMATNIAIHDASSEFDPLTNLRARTHFGRPNWSAIFGGTRAAIESGKYLKGWESTLRSKVGGE